MSRGDPGTSQMATRRLGAASLIVALILVAGLIPATDASAHGERNPALIPSLDGFEPELDGVSAELVPNVVAQVRLRNESTQTLEVLDDDGAPFIRISPRGVEANLNSATWYASGNPDGRFNPPASADIGGPARWKLVSSGTEITYFDHRLHPTAATSGVLGDLGSEPARLSEFEIPLRYGGEPAKLNGHIDYRPLQGQIVAEIDGFEPAPGLIAELLPGTVSGINLTSTRPDRVIVLDREGEPFVRLSPDGAEINLSSLMAREQRGRFRGAAREPGEPPRWRKVSDQPAFGWIDLRTSYREGTPPEEVTDSDVATQLGEWSVPVELSGPGREVSIDGSVSWAPVPAALFDRGDEGRGSSTLILLLVGAFLLAALAAAFLLRSRATRRTT